MLKENSIYILILFMFILISCSGVDIYSESERLADEANELDTFPIKISPIIVGYPGRNFSPHNIIKLSTLAGDTANWTVSSNDINKVENLGNGSFLLKDTDEYIVTVTDTSNKYTGMATTIISSTFNAGYHYELFDGTGKMLNNTFISTTDNIVLTYDKDNGGGKFVIIDNNNIFGRVDFDVDLEGFEIYNGFWVVTNGRIYFKINPVNTDNRSGVENYTFSTTLDGLGEITEIIINGVVFS